MHSASSAPYVNDGTRWRAQRLLTAKVVKTWWGGAHSKRRGNELPNTPDHLKRHTLYTREKPTYDATRTTDPLDRIGKRNEEESQSNLDYSGMTVTINLRERKGMHITRNTFNITLHTKTNWQNFHEKINQLASKHNLTINTTTDKTDMTQLKHSVTLNMTHTKQTHTQTVHIKTILNIPLWSEEPCRKKNKMNTRKNMIGRAALLRREKVKAEYLKKRKDYKLNLQITIDTYKNTMRVTDKLRQKKKQLIVMASMFTKYIKYIFV